MRTGYQQWIVVEVHNQGNVGSKHSEFYLKWQITETKPYSVTSTRAMDKTLRTFFIIEVSDEALVSLQNDARNDKMVLNLQGAHVVSNRYDNSQ